MNKKVEDLILTLTKEQEIYQILLDMAEEKKQVIVENKVKELDKITAKEQGMAMSLVKLENLRGRIVDELMREMDISGIDTISQLANHLAPDERMRINAVKNQLLGVVESLKDLNELNSQLIEQSLRYIDFNLSLMSGLDEENKYSKAATTAQGKQRKNLFDVKV